MSSLATMIAKEISDIKKMVSLFTGIPDATFDPGRIRNESNDFLFQVPAGQTVFQQLAEYRGSKTKNLQVVLIDADLIVTSTMVAPPAAMPVGLYAGALINFGGARTHGSTTGISFNKGTIISVPAQWCRVTAFMTNGTGGALQRRLSAYITDEPYVPSKASSFIAPITTVAGGATSAANPFIPFSSQLRVLCSAGDTYNIIFRDTAGVILYTLASVGPSNWLRITQPCSTWEIQNTGAGVMRYVAEIELIG